MKAFFGVMLALLCTVFFPGCKKDSGNTSTPQTIPVVTTTAESNITATSGQSGGTITSDGGSNITARGICWSRFNSMPTIADSTTSNGSGTGTFTSVLNGLTPFTAYNVRAYATNASGTGYGDKIVILTSPGVTLITGDIVVTDHIRTCETQVSIHGLDFGAPPITETGVCFSTSPNPTIGDSKIKSGPASEIFTRLTIRLLLGINSTFYFRAYATTSAGTTYGNQVTYTTGIDIGLSHGGGIIFFVDNSGQHGRIAAPADQAKDIPWAPLSLFTLETNATSTSDGAGNTTTIINTYGDAGTYAAKVCRDYRGGGFADWYLPSYEEINAMKMHQDAIGGFPASGFLTNYYYWSSTEYDYFRAWDHEFNPRYFFVDANEKRKLSSVRAIRVFN